MFWFKRFMVILILCMPYLSYAETGAPVSVNEMVFCTGIENRTPVGVSKIFPDTVGRVYCFTKLTSKEDHTAISHVWYYNDTQMAIVDLPVNARSWRTWSSKRIVKEWAGRWRVDVISATGAVICSDAFMVSPN